MIGMQWACKRGELHIYIAVLDGSLCIAAFDASLCAWHVVYV